MFVPHNFFVDTRTSYRDKALTKEFVDDPDSYARRARGPVHRKPKRAPQTLPLLQPSHSDDGASKKMAISSGEREAAVMAAAIDDAEVAVAVAVGKAEADAAESRLAALREREASLAENREMRHLDIATARADASGERERAMASINSKVTLGGSGRAGTKRGKFTSSKLEDVAPLPDIALGSQSQSDNKSTLRAIHEHFSTIEGLKMEGIADECRCPGCDTARDCPIDLKADKADGKEPSCAPRGAFPYQNLVAAYTDPRAGFTDASINPSKPDQRYPFNLLVWHSAGSGKTCTMIGAISARRAWEAENKVEQVPIYIVTKTSLVNGYISEMQGGCGGMTAPNVLRKLSGDPNKYSENVYVYSYQKFANRCCVKQLAGNEPLSLGALRKHSTKAVIMVDEAHLLNIDGAIETESAKAMWAREKRARPAGGKDWNPDTSAGALKLMYEEFMHEETRRNPNIQLVFFTATPARSHPFQIGLLLNMISRKALYPQGATDALTREAFEKEYMTDPSTGKMTGIISEESLQRFRSKAVGMVSYYDNAWDTSRVASLVTEDRFKGESFLKRRNEFGILPAVATREHALLVDPVRTKEIMEMNGQGELAAKIKIKKSKDGKTEEQPWKKRTANANFMGMRQYGSRVVCGGLAELAVKQDRTVSHAETFGVGSRDTGGINWIDDSVETKKKRSQTQKDTIDDEKGKKKNKNKGDVSLEEVSPKMAKLLEMITPGTLEPLVKGTQPMHWVYSNIDGPGGLYHIALHLHKCGMYEQYMPWVEPTNNTAAETDFLPGPSAPPAKRQRGTYNDRQLNHIFDAWTPNRPSGASSSCVTCTRAISSRRQRADGSGISATRSRSPRLKRNSEGHRSMKTRPIARTCLRSSTTRAMQQGSTSRWSSAARRPGRG